jgi:hypothetical protein
MVFDFDREVFGSKAYELAVRDALKTVVGRRREDLKAIENRSRVKQSADIDKTLKKDKESQYRERDVLLLGNQTAH